MRKSLVGPWFALLALLGAGVVSACEVVPSGADAGVSGALSDAAGDGISTADPWAGQATGATAIYDLEGKGWHALPFPTDVRRGADGKLDLTGFPPPREGAIPAILQGYLDHAAATLDGWSLQPTVYVRFDTPLDPKLLPNVQATLKPEAVFLVDVDPTSPEHGKLVPLVVRSSGAKRGQHLEANLLMAQPAWGRPLRPATTYAFIVRRGLRDAAGKVLGRPAPLVETLQHLLGGGTAETAPGQLGKLAKSLAPLAQALKAGVITVPPADIAAATVFTTGRPTAQLAAMAQWVRTKAVVKPAVEWKLVDASNPAYTLVTAAYEAPNFQVGKPPYNEIGTGGFAFDATGQPGVQRVEKLRVALALPKDLRLQVQGAIPVVLSAHGTGGNYLSFANGGKYKIGTRLAERGLAVISIDQPLHGPRCDPPIGGDELDMKTFNFLNISAGLSGFRQSALDTVFLQRMVREGKLDVPASVVPALGAVQLDPFRTAFIGHSQGGLSGALVAAVEPSLRALVLSGAGAGISLTVLLRKDPTDIAAALELLLNLDEGEVSELHPVVSLVQALADRTDPLAYGRHVFERPASERPAHLLLTEGLLDEQTPAPTAEALAACMGLGVLAPEVHLNDAMLAAKVPVLPSPASNNLSFNGFGVTGLLSQWAGADHFVIFSSQKASDLYTEFLTTALETSDAVGRVP